MIVFTIANLQKRLNKERAKGKTIGFTPTMGALHDGHGALVSLSIEQNDISIVSIFVNPTQFNEKKDLNNYPRTLKSDEKLLNKLGNVIIFAPSTSEVYPKGLNTNVQVELGGLDAQMEGAFRPGHFEGVVQVVKRMLDIINPTQLFMGQKDFQQFTIIQKMIDELYVPTQLVVVPIQRQDDGLAMSSRNVRLLPHDKSRAVVIYKILKAIKRKKYYLTPEKCIKYAMKQCDLDGFKPEYFYIADGYTLKSIKSWDKHNYIVCCCAVWAGDVRLIDNMIMKKPRSLKLY
jgi:pantoate--beta-alanine ligase